MLIKCAEVCKKRYKQFISAQQGWFDISCRQLKQKENKVLKLYRLDNTGDTFALYKESKRKFKFQCD